MNEMRRALKEDSMIRVMLAVFVVVCVIVLGSAMQLFMKASIEILIVSSGILIGFGLFVGMRKRYNAFRRSANLSG